VLNLRASERGTTADPYPLMSPHVWGRTAGSLYAI